MSVAITLKQALLIKKQFSPQKALNEQIKMRKFEVTGPLYHLQQIFLSSRMKLLQRYQILLPLSGMV